MASSGRRKSRATAQGSPARLIGVLHLPPLAGAPTAQGGDPADLLDRAGDRAAQEARALAQAGFEAVILENFGDAPFYGDRVPPETIASMAVIAAAVKEAAGIPVGINVLRNDAVAALAIAAVTRCDFIRVNVLTGIAATDQGLIEGCAARLVRERGRLRAKVAIFADVHVKHARTLHSSDIALAVEEAAARGLADAVIVTGETTGRPANPLVLERAGEAARAQGVPLYIGSGATAGTVDGILRHVDGVIVGSAIRQGGVAGGPLDAKAVSAFARAFHRACENKAGGGPKN